MRHPVRPPIGNWVLQRARSPGRWDRAHMRCRRIRLRRDAGPGHHADARCGGMVSAYWATPWPKDQFSRASSTRFTNRSSFASP